MVITDDIPPEVSIKAGVPTSNSVTLTVTATDGQSGLAEEGAYTYYLNDEEKASNNTNTYNYTGLTQGTRYTLKVAVTDKAGKNNRKEYRNNNSKYTRRRHRRTRARRSNNIYKSNVE